MNKGRRVPLTFFVPLAVLVFAFAGLVGRSHASTPVLQPGRAVAVIVTGETGAASLSLPFAWMKDRPGLIPDTVEICVYDQWGRLLSRSTATGGSVRVQLEARSGSGLFGPYWVSLRPRAAGATTTSASGRLFVDATETALPPDSSWAVDAAVGDVDLDGDLDLVVVHNRVTTTTQPQLLINDGSGRFTDESATRLPDLNLYPTRVKLVDVDLDGDLDLFVANRGSGEKGFKHTLLINDGTGHFTDESDQRLPQENVCAGSVEFGDLNGDGAPDMAAVPLFLRLDSLSVLIFPNDGQGHFPDSLMKRVSIEPRYTSDISIFDLDGDGDQDLVVGCLPVTFITIGNDTTVTNLTGVNAVLVNEGDWQFREETLQRFPSASDDATGSLLPGDVDGDGDLDLFVSNRGFDGREAKDRLWINDGRGVFSDETASRLPPAHRLWTNGGALADFTGDGAPDLFLPTVAPDSGGVARDRLLINDGRGYFEDRSSTDLPDVLDFSVDAAAGDVDGDGDPDLFVANNTPALKDTAKAINRLYLNTGVLSAVEGEGKAETPVSFALRPAYPNPFNGSTRIAFDLPTRTRLLLTVHNLRGQRVRVLRTGVLNAGRHSLRWDGTDDAGRSVPSGVYLVRLRAGEQVAVRKVVLVR
ncbi:MAG TPA: T9SS type A sorting domain-containing protein [Bacteroidetes bacterium]|nr:T9SS type A sorting domain-containing protein [Bacteroidota bacterium]